jgi:hypothetical protein
MLLWTTYLEQCIASQTTWTIRCNSPLNARIAYVSLSCPRTSVDTIQLLHYFVELEAELLEVGHIGPTPIYALGFLG